MAPSSPPRRAALPLLLVSLLLLLLLFSVVAGHAARAVPAASSRSHAEAELQQDQYIEVDELEKAMSVAVRDERCGGAAAGGTEGEEDEECLMRRTLVAHTDYIYTQGGGHN